MAGVFLALFARIFTLLMSKDLRLDGGGVWSEEKESGGGVPWWM